MHLTEQDLRTSMKKLSRGQRVKIQFLKLIVGNYNLLILDEPTNHLEIDTREEIEEALQEYKGAILVASHDRYFIDKIGIDKTLLMENNTVKEKVGQTPEKKAQPAKFILKNILENL